MTISAGDFYKRYKDCVANNCGWMLDDTGIYRIVTKGDAQKKVYASHIPIVPVCVYNNLDNNTEKVELRFLKRGVVRKLIVQRGVIANKSSIIKLANDGIDVNSDSAPELMRYLSDIINNNQLIPMTDSKNCMGWYRDDDDNLMFVPYDGGIAYDEDENYKHLYKALCTKGDRDAYVEYVRELRRFSKPLRIAMAASFASPIIELIGENPFVLMLHGGTGIAKSVALMVAMSIWGDPAFGKMTRTMDMTANSMMSTAAFLRNLPFAGDELQTIKTRWGNYDNLIMKVTEGVDRGRMTYSQVNETKVWKSAFLFTGEEPCTKQESGGGVKNRVIEIECLTPLVENGNKTANFVKANYGLVAKEYIDALKQYDLNGMYSEMFRTIMSEYNTTDKQAGAMSLLLIADRIARERIFRDDDPLLLSDTGTYLRDANEVDVAERAYDWLVNTIGENVNNFTADAHKVWGVFDADDKHVYFNGTVLNKLLTDAGFDFAACRKKWIDKGYIVNEENAYRIRKRVFGTTVWCYKIKMI